MNQDTNALIKFFKALANEDRLEIIKLLQKEKELCAQDVQKNFYLEQSTTSHHLNKLKLAGITKSRKSGRNIYYSYDEEQLKKTLSEFEQFLDTISES